VKYNKEYFRNIPSVEMNSSKLINYLTNMCWRNGQGTTVIFIYRQVSCTLLTHFVLDIRILLSCSSLESKRWKPVRANKAPDDGSKLMESVQICADAVSCSNWDGDDVFQKVNWSIHLCPKVLEDKAIIKLCL
jgi:hypothetical protein